MVCIWSLLFSFTRCISTPWIFSFAVFSSVSDLNNHSRDPLRSWGSFSLLMFPTFFEETPKWSVNFLIFPAWYVFSPIRHNQGYPLLLLGLILSGISVLLLLSGIWPPDWLFGGASRGLLIPRFSLILRVFRISRKDYFMIVKQRPGNIASCLLLFSYWYK